MNNTNDYGCSECRPSCHGSSALVIALLSLLAVQSAMGATATANNSTDAAVTAANVWVYTGVTISGVPDNAIIQSVQVEWDVDGNYVSDVDFYVDKYTSTYGWWTSSTVTGMTKTGDDWLDGYSETSYQTTTFTGIPAGVKVNGTWYFNIADTYNDANPDFNRQRLDWWRITITYSTPPGLPGTPDLAAADDTGSSSSDNITYQTSALTFSWSAASGAERYYYGWDSSTPSSSYATSLSADATAPAGNGNHTFYVRGWNSTSGYGSASSLTVYIDRNRPSISGLDLRDSDDTGQSSSDNLTRDTNVRYTWTGNANGGSGVYRYWYGWTTSANDASTANAYADVSPPSGNGTYTFYVGAEAVSGLWAYYPDYTDQETVTWDTTAPVPPTFVSPGEWSATTDISPTLDWSPGSGEWKYQVYVREDAFIPTDSRTSPELTASQWTVTPDLTVKDWGWQVKAWDIAGNEGSYGRNGVAGSWGHFSLTAGSCTIQLTVRDADNQGLAGCKGEYHAGGLQRWSKDTDSSGVVSDASSVTDPTAFCRAKTISSRIDVKDEDWGWSGTTVEWDTPAFSTAAGGTFAKTITLNNSSGVNANEGSVSFRETSRGWNYASSTYSFQRGLATVYVDSSEGPSCGGDVLYFPNGRAILDNGIPSSASTIDDTILHEYGHALQWAAYGNTWGRPSGCSCSNHGGTTNDCSFDALIEGWATYFPVMIYHHINSADTHYDWSASTSRKDLESNSGTSIEERHEHAVAGVFWDIYDSVNDGGDTLSLGDDEIWTVMRNDRPQTFEEFFQRFINRYPGNAAALEQICIAHGMHPNWLTLSRTSVDFGQLSVQQVFTISRSGWYGDGTPAAVTPDWSITKDVAWITGVSPLTGATTTETDTITITIDRNALADGVNTGHLTVTPGHYGRAQVITVTATKVVSTISVTPASQDFGSIQVGTTTDRTFSVQNTGGGTLSGSASVPAPFSIASGGSYSLGAGASQTVTVRYSPTATGTHNQNVNFTGGGGATRPVTGSAYLAPEILVTPASQDFGSIQAGTTADRTFSVQNTGGGTLSGSASVSAPYSVVSGGSYNLGAGASQTVTVRYSPTAAGTHNQNVNFTGGGGAIRPVSGSAYQAPAIAVTPASQDFGSIQVGTTADRTFSVQNIGGGTLSGNASVSAPFSIVSGGSYNLGAGASQTVTVRYNPTAAGTHNQNVSFTGGGGATRPVSGSAYQAPAIAVTPASQDFGSIQAGTTADRTFSVQNTGGGTLSGSASVPAPFSIASGGSYSLGAGASQTVTVRYSPTATGTHNQNVSFTGGGGASRQVSGSAYNAPPVFTTTSPLPDGTVGVQYNLTFQGAGGAPPYTFYQSSGNLPAGLDLGVYSGVLTGIPNMPGQYEFSLRIMDTLNSYSYTNFVLTINPEPKRIISLIGDLAFGDVVTNTTAQRTLAITNSGNSPLNVTGIGYPSGFSGPWSGSIPSGGSTNVIVTFAPTDLTSYAGTVTVTNNSTSGVNTLAASGTGVFVTPRQLTGMSMSNGVFRFVLNGPVGSNYVIQVSSNLVNWVSFSTNPIPASGWVPITDPSINNQTRRFYRAVPVAASAPTLVPVGHIDNGGYARNVVVTGNYAYLANEADGLRVYDISNPVLPLNIGHANTGDWAWGLAVAGNVAYLANFASGLRTYNISNPASPTSLGQINNGGQARGVAVSGNYAYLANGNGGLRIYNIANPAAPVSVGQTNNGGFALRVAVASNHAYLANDTDGLRIYNVSNPASPSNVGHIDSGGKAIGVAVSGTHVYLANGTDGLRIYDVSNPATPVGIGHINEGGEATSVVVQGNYAFLANLNDGLRIYDISNPANPVSVGHIDEGGTANDVAVSGAYVYLANYDDGLRIYSFSSP